jgi:hypothetical protein
VLARVGAIALLRSVICLAFLLVACVSAFGQLSGNATLRGRVTDASGAVVTGVDVTLVNEATKDERKTKTNDDGFYVFSSVTPGTYTVRIAGKGFKIIEQKSVILAPSETRAVDVALEAGIESETVTVTATAERLETETGAKENTITAKQIDNLSIISRSALELLRVLPGVVAPDNTDLEQVSFGGGANANNAYHVNGLRGEQNNITVDGAQMIDIGSNNGTVITANPDMVQEVRVQTSNYAAEHGTSAVQINATTKGGSSQFHGSVYDYIRDFHFQANDRSNSINGVKRPESKYNYPGGNIGGPVILPWTQFNRNRDKLFFFFGFEYYYQRVDEGSSLFQVPTEQMRQGDFSGVSGIHAPAGCNVPNFNGNLSTCKSNLGAALLNLYPLPNFSDAAGHNYVYSVLRPNDRNQATGRVDYSISDNTKLWVKLAREYEEQGFPRGLWWNSASYELPGKLTSYNTGRSVVADLTSIINPTMTNEVLFAASKLKLYYDYADPSKVTYAGLGLTDADKAGFLGKNSSRCSNCADVNFIGNNPYVPVSVLTWGSGELFTAYGFPIYSPYDSYSITDNLTKVYNSHTLKFGAFVEQANKLQQSNHDTDIVLGQWGQANGTGNNFGDLYVGRPIEFSQATDRPVDHFRYYNYEFYAQDSWKVRPNITIEYGLRLGYFPQNFERNGLGTLFDPTAYDTSQGIFIDGDRTRPNGFKLASRGEIPKGILPNVGVQWMPRLNFAWDIGGKGEWVVRAGAGLFYNRVQGNYDYYSSGQMPNTYSATVDTPWNSVNGSDGLSFGNLKDIDPFQFANVNVSSRDINSNEIPRVANMSLTIEKKLPGNNILTAAYVGTQGRHLPQQRSINIIPIGTLLSGVLAPGSANPSDLSIPVNRAAIDGSVLRTFRPFSAYNTVGVYQFTGTSSYHSLQVTLSHQSGRWVQYFATYTFGKALGTVATNETDGSAWADPIDTRGRSWGVLPFDRTHVFNLSYNINIPNLARGALNHSVGRGILNGWQMSGITTIQSGIPLRLRFTGDISGAGQAVAWFGSDAFNVQGQSSGAITPVYLSNPLKGGTKLGQKVFDINALAIPDFPNSGPSQPPFYLRTPGRSNFDVSFFKNFAFSESKKIQFRAGFFNIFNQAYPTQFNVTDISGASDISLALDTVCNRTVANVPNGTGGTAGGNTCDPTGGFRFTDGRPGDRSDTVHNFGKIQNKHGRRIVEFALKFYF